MEEGQGQINKHLLKRRAVMAAIKNEEILGYIIDGEHVCCECAEAKEVAEAKQDELILDSDDDASIFCDRCKERIV